MRRYASNYSNPRQIQQGQFWCPYTIVIPFKSDIFIVFADLSSWNFFDKKKDITKKKISRHISFDFLGQNPHILSGKRLPQTAKNGVQKKASFFEWTFWKLMVTLVGYFRKKTGQIYFLQKICKKRSVPVEIQKKNVDLGPLFCWIWAKKHVTSVIFLWL